MPCSNHYSAEDGRQTMLCSLYVFISRPDITVTM